MNSRIQTIRQEICLETERIGISSHCVHLNTETQNLSEVLLFFIIFSGSAAQRGLWTLRSRGFLITHNDAPQSVGLLWTSDQLVTDTST
jgi:hypothetical protein